MPAAKRSKASPGGVSQALPDTLLDAAKGGGVPAQKIKGSVFAEAFRVLRPGGRLAVSDVVVRGWVPPFIRRNAELWIGCIAGALEEKEYRGKLLRAGFKQVHLEPTRIYRAADAREFLGQVSWALRLAAPLVNRKFMSAFVRARKPRRINRFASLSASEFPALSAGNAARR